MHTNHHLTNLFDLSSCPGREEAECMARYRHIQTLATERLDPQAIAAWVWLIYDFDPTPIAGQTPALAFLYALPETARTEFFHEEYGFSRVHCGSKPLQIQEGIVAQLCQSPIDGSWSKSASSRTCSIYAVTISALSLNPFS